MSRTWPTRDTHLQPRTLGYDYSRIQLRQNEMIKCDVYVRVHAGDMQHTQLINPTANATCPIPVHTMKQTML